MLPRWHIILGVIFTGAVWAFIPSINKFYLGLVLFSSIFIDFDHYIASVIKTKKLSFFHALRYHKKVQEIEEKEHKRGLRRKGDFHLFHTIEFHLLIGLLSLLWTGFFFIFIGMAFHLFLDLFSLIKTDKLYRKEFFFTNWLANKLYFF